MFVYQSGLDRGAQRSKEALVENFFHRPERWAERVSSTSLILVLSALVLGGVSKVVSLPAAAFGFTVLALAWVLGEDRSDGEPLWINRLSLAATGMLYFGIGHCLGLIVMLGLPVLAKLCRD